MNKKNHFTSILSSFLFACMVKTEKSVLFFFKEHFYSKNWHPTISCENKITNGLLKVSFLALIFYSFNTSISYNRPISHRQVHRSFQYLSWTWCLQTVETIIGFEYYLCLVKNQYKLFKGSKNFCFFHLNFSPIKTVNLWRTLMSNPDATN